MTGTLINIATVTIGGTLGAVLGDKLPERFRNTVFQGIGLVVLSVGMSMSLTTRNPVLMLLSVLLGSALGEWWRLEARLDSAGSWLEARTGQVPLLARGDFTRGFVTASLVFCAGPMTILGSIQDGLTGDYTLLAIKSTMDGFAAFAFAAAMGMGATFAALTVMIVQGGLTLGASLFDAVLNEEMINEMSAVGGIIMLGLGVSMLEIKKIKVANMLPALVTAPLLTAIWNWLALGDLFH